MPDTQNLSLARTKYVYGNGANATVGTPPDVQEEQSEKHPWVLSFGFKNDPVEVEYEGEIGLICEGWASKYNEEDASGEYQAEGAFNSIGEEWGAQQEPLVLFNHATDHVLGARRIGRGIGYKLQPEGLYVKVFVPRDAADSWKDKRAKKRFGEIYQGIKSGAIRAFSVGGGFTRFGKKLARWSTLELSITPTPCLASATFSLGSKALVEQYGAVPAGLDDSKQEQSVLGKVTRPHWNAVMGMARQDNDAALHDHLLGYNYDPPFQGKHDSEDCSICESRRDMMGIKMDQENEDGMDGQMMGVKAVTKSEPDGTHPSSHYLSVGDASKPTTWKLRYKDASGKIAPRLLGACHAALTVGYRGNKVDLPQDEKQRCLAKLKRLYKQEGLDWPEGDSGQGGKTDDFDYSDVLQEATLLLADYSQGVKAGKRHSKATKDAVAGVVQHLTNYFGLKEDNDPDEATETSED